MQVQKIQEVVALSGAKTAASQALNKYLTSKGDFFFRVMATTFLMKVKVEHVQYSSYLICDLEKLN